MSLCDKCQKNTATVLVESIINGKKSENYLCQECAKSLQGNISFDNFLKNFLETMYSFNTDFVKESPPNANTSVCDACGQTYEEFKQSSRLGCANCYEAFHPQLSVVLKNIQGSNIHDGKIPNKSGAELLYKKELESLKKQLKNAIQAEEYEEAARLRDLIKQKQADYEAKE